MTQYQAQRAAPGRGVGWASSGVLFAGVLMIVEGALGVLQGIAAIAEDDVYERVGSYVYEFDLTGWGWVHVILGALVFVVGLGLVSGTSAVRVPAIVLAVLSVVANFMWLPYTPVWSITLIAIGVFIIWALSTSQPSDTRRT